MGNCYQRRARSLELRWDDVFRNPDWDIACWAMNSADEVKNVCWGLALIEESKRNADVS